MLEKGQGAGVCARSAAKAWTAAVGSARPGDVVVPRDAVAARQFYDLERLWQGAEAKPRASGQPVKPLRADQADRRRLAHAALGRRRAGRGTSSACRASCPLELVEVPLVPAARTRRCCPPDPSGGRGDAQQGAAGERIVTLDTTGKPWSTEQPGCRTGTLASGCATSTLLVGGPEGLAPVRAQSATLVAITADPAAPAGRILVGESRSTRPGPCCPGHPYHK